MAQVTSLSCKPHQRWAEGLGAGLVAAWIPGSRKYLRMLLGSAPVEHWEEAGGAEGEEDIPLVAVWSQGRLQRTLGEL